MIASFKDLVEGLDKLYDFGKKLLSDVSKYIQTRDENKLLHSLREYISAYDAELSKLKAKIEYEKKRQNNEWFETNKTNIEAMFYKLIDTYSETIQNFLQRAGEFLPNDPVLRDALIIKFQFEGVDEFDSDPFPEEIRTLSCLYNWINAVGEKTREALTLLNRHLA